MAESTKVAIITGASSGLGREAALIARQYFKFDELWLVARRLELLNSLKSEILARDDTLCVKIIQLDLNKDSASTFASHFIKTDNKKQESKNIDIVFLMNNAGFGTYGEFMETPIERTNSMIDLNCTVVADLCYECIPFMNAGSVILNVASLAAFAPLGNFCVYAASKAFVLQFSLALRAELKTKKISVTAMCPGSVSTQFARVASNGARKEVLHGVDTLKVARHALNAAKNGSPTAIMGIKWKLSALFSHVIPCTLIANFTYKFCKRPCNK